MSSEIASAKQGTYKSYNIHMHVNYSTGKEAGFGKIQPNLGNVLKKRFTPLYTAFLKIFSVAPTCKFSPPILWLFLCTFCANHQIRLRTFSRPFGICIGSHRGISPCKINSTRIGQQSRRFCGQTGAFVNATLKIVF